MARQSTSRKKKKRLPQLLVSDLVHVDSPSLFYQVQQAFQNHGVHLINLDTGEVILGQINVSDIGLLEAEHHSFKLQRRETGFIQKLDDNLIVYDRSDIEAVLVFEAQNPNGPLSFLIQVIDDQNIDRWSELALTVAKEFVSHHQKALRPEVVFTVTSLSRGNHRDSSAKNAILRKIQGYGFDSSDAVSSITLDIEDDFEDEDDEGEDFGSVG